MQIWSATQWFILIPQQIWARSRLLQQIKFPLSWVYILEVKLFKQWNSLFEIWLIIHSKRLLIMTILLIWKIINLFNWYIIWSSLWTSDHSFWLIPILSLCLTSLNSSIWTYLRQPFISILISFQSIRILDLLPSLQCFVGFFI